MNPAEEIVKYWMQQQGYFVQSSIHIPKGQNREIDILAIHEKENIRRQEKVIEQKLNELTNDIDAMKRLLGYEWILEQCSRG
jgi:hypothetical protein